MPIASESVAAELRAEIARQSRTITDVAAAAGMVPTTMARKLKGIYPFDIDELIKVCGVLGINPSGLLARTENGARR